MKNNSSPRDNKKTPVSAVRAVIVGPHIRDREDRSKLFRFLTRHRAKKAVLIGNPLSGAVARQSILTTSENGDCHRLVLLRYKEVGYLSSIMDMVITVCFFMISRSRYDVFFGLGVSYTSLGLLLRKLRLVKRVVFWTTDYFPSEVSLNRFSRWIYGNLQKRCAASVDYLWDVSPSIKEARRESGLRFDEVKVIPVPYMLERDEIAALPPEQTVKYSAIQSGWMRDSEFELVLKAWSLVTAALPLAKLSLTSHTPVPESWATKVKEYGLQNNVDIMGYIEDEAELARIIQRRRVGLVIYEPTSFKNRGDPGRAKTYLAGGVPVVITRGPFICEAIASHRAGIVIDYNEEEQAQAILRLLTDDQFYEECHENASKLTLEYDADVIFKEALQRMNILV